MERYKNDTRSEGMDMYKAGEWDMFCSLTSILFGKMCYFMQENGVVYSRLTNSYLRDADEAYKEWVDIYEND